MTWLKDYGTRTSPVAPPPLRLIVKRQWDNSWHGGWVETLECGHVLLHPPHNTGKVRRRCRECADPPARDIDGRRQG